MTETSIATEQDGHRLTIDALDEDLSEAEIAEAINPIVSAVRHQFRLIKAHKPHEFDGDPAGQGPCGLCHLSSDQPIHRV